jgi:predicted O-methyltransferase YrrM
MTDDLESRWTPARDWCPHPEYWHSPDSEATEVEVSEFIGSLVRMIQPDFVLETGTYMGHTTLEIARALYMNGHGRGISLEADGNLAAEAQRRLQNFMGSNNTVQVLNMNSMEYNPIENIDFAFFDSWQEGRILEFEKFYNAGWLKKGAIVAFHDTAPHHQVRKSIVEGGHDYFTIIDFHTPRGLVLGQVK